MTTLTVHLPDDAVKYLERKAREGGHASLDACLAAVVHEARRAEARKAFEAKVREGLDSGPMEPHTAEDMDAIWEEAMAILEAERSRV